MPHQFLADLTEAPLPVPVYSPGLVTLIRGYQAQGLLQAELPTQADAPAIVTAITPEGYQLLRNLRTAPTWAA